MIARRIAAVTLLVVALTASVWPLASADDNVNGLDVTGTVTVAATAPSLNFSLYSDPDYNTQTKQMTPQVPVYMKIGVSTDNWLQDVVITVQMFADNDNTQVGTPPDTTSPETYVKFTISYDSTIGDWVITVDDGSSGGSTWQIQLDPNKDQPGPADTSGYFYVIITPGKTAREANTGDRAVYADWDIKVTASVTDTTGTTQSTTVDDFGYTMYFYSEVTSDASTVDFGYLQPGNTQAIQKVILSDGTEQTQDYFTVNVIANGYYNLTITSDASWVSSDSIAYITLTTDKPGNGEFRLNASTAKDATTGELVNPVSVTSSIDTASPLVELAAPTTESGTSYNIYMTIELGTGIHVNTYSGAITVTAIDG